MSPQDDGGSGDWESEKKRLIEKWNAETRPGLEAIYERRYVTRGDAPTLRPQSEVPSPPVKPDPENAKIFASKLADSQLEEHLLREKEKFDQKEAAEEKAAAVEKNRQIEAQLESVRRPEVLRQQSYAALTVEVADVASGKESGEQNDAGTPREKPREIDAKEQAEKDKQQADKEQQEKSQVLTPSKRVTAVRDMTAVQETERQVAAELAARDRDMSFVQTAREITERKVGDRPDGTGLEKSEVIQPVEGTQEPAAKAKVEVEVEEKQGKSFAQQWEEMRRRNVEASQERAGLSHERDDWDHDRER